MSPDRWPFSHHKEASISLFIPEKGLVFADSPINGAMLNMTPEQVFVLLKLTVRTLAADLAFTNRKVL